MIRKHFPPDYRGHVIDVGASDGVSVNSTYTLEKLHRWTVLSVEANPFYKPYLQANRAFVEMCACSSESKESAPFFIHTDNPEAYSGLEIVRHPKFHAKSNATWKKTTVPVRTVDELLAKWQFPSLDAICVDVEGCEVEVLKGCDFNRWKPKVVVVEAWDKTGPTHDYVKSLGYHHVDTLVQNYVYARDKR
jgi:FkbM family methyltransferase